MFPVQALARTRQVPFEEIYLAIDILGWHQHSGMQWNAGWLIDHSRATLKARPGRQSVCQHLVTPISITCFASTFLNYKWWPSICYLVGGYHIRTNIRILHKDAPFSFRLDRP